MAVFGKMEKGEKMKELDFLIVGALALCVYVKLDKSKPAGKIGDDGSCCDGCTGGLACDDKLPQNQDTLKALIAIRGKRGPDARIPSERCATLISQGTHEWKMIPRATRKDDDTWICAPVEQGPPKPRKHAGRLGTPTTQPYPDGYGRPDTFSFFGQEGGAGDHSVDSHTNWITRKIRDAEREANRRGVDWRSLPIG